MAFLGNNSNNKEYKPSPPKPKGPQLCPHCNKDINAAPSEIPTANSPEFVKHMIQAIQMEAAGKLSPWESEFISSVATKERLSAKQVAIIERIYGEKV